MVRDADRGSLSNSPAETGDMHEQWLVERAEQTIAQVAAVNDPQQVLAVGKIIVDAFKLLGLSSHASDLEAKLASAYE